MSFVGDPNTDPYSYIGIERNSDGSITRDPHFFQNSPPSPNPDNSILVLSKDIPINESKHTWARVYLPRLAFDASLIAKLPLLVYYHGGGFILGSASNTRCHDFCYNLAVEIPAMVISVEYRLAPEHRLPGAYEDCVEALYWLKSTNEEWVTKYADFSNCFLMGTSAGGNIVYHVGLHAITCLGDLEPMKIRGLILHQPFFGGIKRTPSELRLANDKLFPPHIADIMWELSLPTGVDYDHEYCNPMMGFKIELLDQIKAQRWKYLVTGCHGDPLVDRQIELVKLLAENGVSVRGEFKDGGFHGYEIWDESEAKVLFRLIKEFVK